MSFGKSSPIAVRISTEDLPTRSLDRAKPSRSGTVSISQIITLLPIFDLFLLQGFRPLLVGIRSEFCFSCTSRCESQLPIILPAPHPHFVRVRSQAGPFKFLFDVFQVSRIDYRLKVQIQASTNN